MPIANVTLSNTFDEWRIRHNVITVNVNALQNTATGLNYTVANNVHAFLNIRSGDGSEASPAITNFGDTSTGIRFPSNGQFAVTANSTDALTIDSTRNAVFSNAVTVQEFTANRDSTFDGSTVTFNANSVHSGQSTFNNSSTFNSDVTHNASVTFEDLTNFNNLIAFNANASFDSSAVTFNANSTFNGDATFENLVTLNDPVNINDAATFNSNTVFGGNLVNVNANTVFNDSVTYNQIVTFNDAVTHSANVSVTGTSVSVSANTTLSGESDLTGLVRLKNTVTLGANIIPDTDATYNIGSASNTINNIYSAFTDTATLRIGDVGGTSNAIVSVEYSSNFGGATNISNTVPTTDAAQRYTDATATALAIALG